MKHTKSFAAVIFSASAIFSQSSIAATANQAQLTVTGTVLAAGCELKIDGNVGNKNIAFPDMVAANIGTYSQDVQFSLGSCDGLSSGTAELQLKAPNFANNHITPDVSSTGNYHLKVSKGATQFNIDGNFKTVSSVTTKAGLTDYSFDAITLTPVSNTDGSPVAKGNHNWVLTAQVEYK